MAKVVIIGASSGIGEALALHFARNGHELGLSARRTERLEAIKQRTGSRILVSYMDVSRPEEAREQLEKLIEDLGGMDIIVLNAGMYKASLNYEDESRVFAVNVKGFQALCNAAHGYFEAVGRGHIVGISSIVALRGEGFSPVYSASKAFVSNYLEGLRKRYVKKKLPIDVSDIRPGYVDTPLIKGSKGAFWVTPPDKAAHQIYDAIMKKKAVAYISRRWTLIAFLLKVLPRSLYNRV